MAAVLLFASFPSSRAEGEIFGSAAAGATVSLSVSADGSPAPTFQWLKAGVAIPGATTNTLVLSGVSAADSAVYNAVATNSLGWSLSNDLILTVNAASAAPTFTLQPFPSASVTAGGAFTLSVAATGTPAPTYQWSKNGVPISGATNATLSFAALNLDDTGTYTAVASNLAGSATSNKSNVTVTTTVDANALAPVITTQPVSQNASLKSSVTFTVAAKGSPAPTYQWLKNGSPIAGATASSYVIALVDKTHDGTYSAIATNVVGSATSNEATLTVTP